MLCCLFVFRCNALRVSKVLCIIMLSDIAPVKSYAGENLMAMKQFGSTLSVVRDADPRICGTYVLGDN